jgi:hypothetical protein
MKIGIPNQNEAAFQKATEDRLKELQGKIDGSEVLLAELKKLMDDHQVLIPEVPKTADPAINKKVFEREVNALLDANAIGFIGKHRMAIRRIQDLALLIETRQRQLKELQNTHDERAKLLKDRQAHEKGLHKMLIDARTETRRLALDLQRLQQELFLAQVDLAGAHAYNLYLDNRLRQVERQKAKTAGGKSQ